MAQNTLERNRIGLKKMADKPRLNRPLMGHVATPAVKARNDSGSLITGHKSVKTMKSKPIQTSIAPSRQAAVCAFDTVLLAFTFFAAFFRSS